VVLGLLCPVISPQFGGSTKRAAESSPTSMSEVPLTMAQLRDCSLPPPCCHSESERRSRGREGGESISWNHLVSEIHPPRHSFNCFRLEQVMVVESQSESYSPSVSPIDVQKMARADACHRTTAGEESGLSELQSAVLPVMFGKERRGLVAGSVTMRDWSPGEAMEGEERRSVAESELTDPLL
jgi:hypothetical protein